MSTFRTLSALSFAAAALSAPAQTRPAAPPADAAVHEEPISLEQLIVTGSAFAKAQADLAQSTAALAGRALALQQSNSLGETLAGETGVAATYFGPGASRPVIRGLGGDRVRVLENGLGTFDVSNVSPDHAVSTEPLFVERIEVVRGPATLFYGNAAIGGVVNTIDGRIPAEPANAPLAGELAARFGGAADEHAGALKLRGGDGAFAWQARVFRREAGDTAIPGANFHEHAGEENAGPAAHLVRGFIPNTSLTGDGRSFGATWFGRAVRVGAAFTGYDTNYGVPPGAHEHADGASESSAATRSRTALRAAALDEPDDEFVRIGLRQRRADFSAETAGPLGVFTRAKLEAGVADYEHTEFEGAAAGTQFRQKSREARLELPHESAGDLTGALGFQYQFSDLAAAGDEAFLPPVRTTNRAAFVSEEKPVGRVTLQGGARIERLRVEPDGFAARRFTPVSLSLGAVWAIDAQWGLAVSAARTQRAPNATELFADGPHAGTGAFERGDAALGVERARSLEVSLRRRAGFVTGAASVFTNRFANYVFEEATGTEEDGLPVYRFVARAAKFEGCEIETWWHLHGHAGAGLDLKLAADAVRATERASGEPLPRIPARRVLGALRYAHGPWVAGVDVARTFAQDRVAAAEETTGGYTLLGADMSWRFAGGNEATAWLVFLRGTNLTDAEARNHVSFLKDVAPLPGRGITAGVRATF